MVGDEARLSEIFQIIPGGVSLILRAIAIIPTTMVIIPIGISVAVSIAVAVASSTTTRTAVAATTTAAVSSTIRHGFLNQKLVGVIVVIRNSCLDDKKCSGA